MKKILAFLLAFSLVFGIAACSSGPKPEDSVKKFCEAAKAFDFAAMAACCDESFDPNEIINTEEEDLTGLMNYLKENAAGITYKLGPAQVDGEKALVPATLEYVDASAVLSEAFSNLFAQLFSMIFSETSEEEMNQAFAECLANAIANNETARTTRECTFGLALKDGAWTIVEMPEEIGDVLTSNMVTAMESIGDIFDSGEDWSEVEPVVYPIANEVLFDNESASMTIESGESDEWGDAAFQIVCENKGDKELTFRIDHAIVDGWYINSFVHESVAPGKKAVTELSLYGSDLKELGIEEPGMVTIPVQVYNEDDWWNDIYLVNETFTFYPTELEESQVRIPERPVAEDETVLTDNELFTMILLGEAEDDYWSDYLIKAYIRNNSDKDLNISWDDVSVNGYMIDPYFGTSLPAGQQTLCTISFSSSDFGDSGIETVEDIEFTLNAEDASWDNVFSETFTYRP